MDDNIIQLAERMKETGKRKFLLQLPQGLNTKAVEIAEFLEEKGFDITLSANPCYGACDLALEEAELSGADMLVHVGHSKFYNNIESRIPVLYFPWKINIDLEGIDISNIKENKIGILSTIQHMDALNSAREFFERNGKIAIIGGQILGCHTTAAYNIEDQVEAFVFIGSGNFHPLALKSRKPVYSINVEKRTAEKVDNELWEKRRWANIYKTRGARSFGILVSRKPGQRELLGTAESLRDRIKKENKKAIIIYLDEITEENLTGFMVDAFVNTACPRITDNNWKKPVINAGDLEEALKE